MIQLPVARRAGERRADRPGPHRAVHGLLRALRHGLHVQRLRQRAGARPIRHAHAQSRQRPAAPRHDAALPAVIEAQADQPRRTHRIQRQAARPRIRQRGRHVRVVRVQPRHLQDVQPRRKGGRRVGRYARKRRVAQDQRLNGQHVVRVERAVQVQLDAHAPVGALLDQLRKVRVGQRLGAVLRGGVAQGQAERSGQSGARGQRQRQREGEQETKALHRYIKPPLP